MMVGWLPALVGFFIVTFVTGLSISIVFQLAHVVEETQFHSPNEHGAPARQEWAIHQIISTANFATGSRVLHWLLGGLNFQIEHHLFPRISHIHYPQVSRLVKEACRQSNVTYIEYKSMFQALASHLMHLKRLGRAD
jgi:linoleoyl-CoA desaturase